MAEMHRVVGTRRRDGGSDRDKALLASRLAKASGELLKAKTEASHYRMERDTARADADQLSRQMAKQQWLVAGLEQARDGQLEDTAAAEAVILKLATEMQEARQEVKQEKKRAAVASFKEAEASRMLDDLYNKYEILKERLQQQQEKVRAAETEADEARLKLASLESSLQEQHKHATEKDSTITNLMKELADVRVVRAALQSRCREQQQIIERLKRERQTGNNRLKIMEKTNTRMRRDMEQEHERGRQLAHQLVRRNDQVQVLQERNCLLQHLQVRGNLEYACRTRDIYYLSAEVTNLRDQLSHMVRQAELNRALKVELTRMQRELVASFHKRSALETQVMLSRVGDRGRVVSSQGTGTEDSTVVRQAQALQQKLLKAAQAQAESSLQRDKRKELSALLRAGNEVSEVTNLVGLSRATIHAIKKHMDEGKGVNVLWV
ncbi:hypothetical protein FHG87_007970 [Trinorchestia longiramus]|nr:hypothetical protein FHG87_007970 [Trinorchestia longiramus]